VPCKPRMAGCSVRCGHKAMVLDYRIARFAAEQLREAETFGHQTEMDSYNERVQPITFKRWLEGRTGDNPFGEGGEAGPDS
jgi:hypothetical protein